MSNNNEILIRKHLQAVVDQDMEVFRDTMAPDVKQWYQRPSCRRDDGEVLNDHLVGREKIVKEVSENFYVTLYQKGTVEIGFERFVTEGEWTAVQWWLSGKTIRTNSEYKNYYFFMYHIQDGHISEYWEHVDSSYANKVLYPDQPF